MCYTDQEGEPGKNNQTNKGSYEFLKYEQTWFSFQSQDKQILLFHSGLRKGEFFVRPMRLVAVTSFAISCYFMGKNMAI